MLVCDFLTWVFYIPHRFSKECPPRFTTPVYFVLRFLNMGFFTFLTASAAAQHLSLSLSAPAGRPVRQFFKIDIIYSFLFQRLLNTPLGGSCRKARAAGRNGRLWRAEAACDPPTGFAEGRLQLRTAPGRARPASWLPADAQRRTIPSATCAASSAADAGPGTGPAPTDLARGSCAGGGARLAGEPVGGTSCWAARSAASTAQR